MLRVTALNDSPGMLILCVRNLMDLFTCIETEIITSVKPGSSGFSSSNRVRVIAQSLEYKHNQVNTLVFCTSRSHKKFSHSM